MLRYLLSAIFLFGAGLSNGVMDSLQFHFERTVFADPAKFDPQFWNPALSWSNKYKDHTPANGEAFLGSSTFLVFTTDGWHLAKFIMLKFFVLAVLAFGFGGRLYFSEVSDWVKMIIGFVVFTLCYQAGFTLSYV
jgi:hypothetical protein